MKELQKYHNKMENFYYELKFNIIYKIKMTTYYEYGVNLTDNQKSKLASAITENSPLTLRLKHSHLKGSDELIGTLSIDDEMARRRRPEVKFSRANLLGMRKVVKTSSSLRRRRNSGRFAVVAKT